MRSYTPALKIPKFIGRLKDGTRLPGGPYTLTQFLVGVAVLVCGYVLMPMWAQLLPNSSSDTAGWLIAHVVLIAVAGGSAYITGYIPADTNPIHAVGGLISGGRPNQFGIQAGRAVDPLPKPRHYRSRVLIEGAEQTQHPHQAPEADLSDLLLASSPAHPAGRQPGPTPVPASPDNAVAREPAGHLRALTAAIVKE